MYGHVSRKRASMARECDKELCDKDVWIFSKGVGAATRKSNNVTRKRGSVTRKLCAVTSQCGPLISQ